jgi:hypothetical protein
MAPRNWLLSLISIGVLASCQGPRYGDFIREETVVYPHLVSIELPSNVRVDVMANCVLTLSTDTQPALLTHPGRKWLVKRTSEAYTVGVEGGAYQPGIFIGVALVPAAGSPAPGTRLTVPLQFDSPGTKYLYFAHIGEVENGGLQVQELDPNSPVYPYPGNPPFEYKELTIEVLP